MPECENKMINIYPQEVSKKDQKCNRENNNIDRSQEDDFDLFGVSLD